MSAATVAEGELEMRWCEAGLYSWPPSYRFSKGMLFV